MSTNWNRFQNYLLRHDDGELKFTLDLSRMDLEPDWLDSKADACKKALEHVEKLEAGEKINTDENRMVGHYWLRAPQLAPAHLRQQISSDIAGIKSFAKDVQSGVVTAGKGGNFSKLLLIGIGGSALGPQFVDDALGSHDSIETWFLDNTDPAGIDRVLEQIGQSGLDETLTIVTSKSGKTPETRNGMLEAKRAYEKAGLSFAKHAVAITGPGSLLDDLAKEENWLERFHMSDWVGGRTSIMSVVGLLPAALQGVDIDDFLEGAASMDRQTRISEIKNNPAMLLALAWYEAGNGKGEKDMVVLPYKDRLQLFSKYLQQLIMESLGKELDRGGEIVHQGIAVYGNKGSTDQHAYVQQLRDGVNNFFAIFIEVQKGRGGNDFVVDSETDATSGDYLQGFLRGTREALTGNERESITITLPQIDAFHLGALIALFERAVTFYADLVNINAYHQPGVEAGKKAAGDFLNLMRDVRAHLDENSGAFFSAEAIAAQLQADPETVYHILNHLEANYGVQATRGKLPADDEFKL